MAFSEVTPSSGVREDQFALRVIAHLISQGWASRESQLADYATGLLGVIVSRLAVAATRGDHNDQGASVRDEVLVKLEEVPATSTEAAAAKTSQSPVVPGIFCPKGSNSSFNRTVQLPFDSTHVRSGPFASPWPRTDDFRSTPINRHRYRASASLRMCREETCAEICAIF